MNYQKQNFANGEVLTASQLNHIEDGIVDVESAANATKTVVDKIIDPTLSLSGKAADAAKVGEAINAESERAKGVENQIKEDVFQYGLQTKTYTQTMMSGYYAEVSNNTIALKQIESLDTIYFFTTEELSVYFDTIPDNPYFSICVGIDPYSQEWAEISSGYQIQNRNGASRVRKLDNNLPTVNNKLTIPSGSLVCITVTKGTNAYLCFDGYDKTHLNPNIEVIAEIQKEKINISRDSINGWTCIKTGNAKYLMSVDNQSGSNTNIFRFRECYLTDDDAEIMLLWDSEEDAEGVVKLLDETDFIGGYHGSEQMTSCSIIADGKILSNSEILNVDAKNITIIVASNVFHCWRDASVKDLIAFRRTKKIVFENNSVSISNHWVSVGTNKVISAPLMSFQTKFGDNQVNYYTDNTDCKLWDVPKTENANIPTLSKELTRFDVFAPNTTITIEAIRGQNNEHYRGYVANFYQSNRVKFYLNYIYNILSGVEYEDGQSLDAEFKITFN